MSQGVRRLDQDRALSAHQAVEGIRTSAAKGGSGQGEAEYLSLVKRFPGMVINSGLPQALSYLTSRRSENDKDCLYRHLNDWLTSSKTVVWANTKDPGGSEPLPGDLLDLIMSTTSTSLMQATSEALAYLAWLKRMAEAQLDTGS